MKKKNSTSGLSPFCQFIEIGFFFDERNCKKKIERTNEKKNQIAWTEKQIQEIEWNKWYENEHKKETMM